MIDWNQTDPYWLTQVKEFLAAEPPPRSLTPGVEQQTAEAIQALRSGRAAAAEAAARTAINASGEHPAAVAFSLSLLACSLLGQGDISGAAQAVTRASHYAPHHPALTYSAGLIELRRGRIDAAAALFERAVDLSPAIGHAWAGLAIIRSLQQDHHGTELAARRALELNVPLGGRLVELALLQATYHLGKPIEGACDFSSLRQAPDSLIAQFLPRLPPVPEGAFDHPADGRPILFIYADHTYVIKHAMPLMLSLKAVATTCRIHLHVANPGYQLQPLLARLSQILAGIPLVVSTETVQPSHFAAAPPIYHSCVRFVRCHSLLQRARQPVLMLDADLLARGDPHGIFKNAPTADVILPESKHDPLWGRIFAGGVGLRPTPGGLAYAARVAALILDNLIKQTGRWFLDQIALQICRDFVPPGTTFALPTKQSIASRTFAAEAFFSSVVNEQKEADNAHTRLKRHLVDEAKLSALVAPREYRTGLISTPQGPLLVDEVDTVIGRSLRETGSWCPQEIHLLSQLIGPGQTVVDGGANIGTHTVAFAKVVGSHGRVFAFEPQRLVFQQLAGNLALNRLTNVFAFQKGLGSEGGTSHVDAPKFENNIGAVRLCGPEARTLEQVDIMLLDDLDLDACHLIKLDVEEMEHAALTGAAKTIARHRPVLSVENHNADPNSPLARLIHQYGYRMFWLGVATKNSNLLCLPNESPVWVKSLEPLIPS